MGRRSIRFRITALAVGAVVVVLLIVSLMLILAQRAQLTAAIDDALRQRAADIESMVVVGRLPREQISTSDDTFTQILGVDGEMIVSTPHLGDTVLPSPEPDQPIRTIDLPEIDDDPFRLLSRHIESEAGSLVLHVGASYDFVTESVSVLAASLAVAIPAVALVLGSTVWWLVGRTLDPVEQIRSEVSTIGASELGRRVPEPTGSDEIARLAGTMNEMLDRIQVSVERQQTFVADASHELRNPLTRMRTTLEVEIAGLQPGEERNALSSTLEDVVALQALVEDLLHLARSDAGEVVVRREPVDLDEIIRQVASPLESTHGGPIVDTRSVEPIQVSGDPVLLGRAVQNLVDNATRHARSRVVISLAEDGEEALLVIEDDGPGIPAAEREHIFERFARLDESRSREHGGTGLGLAITRDIVERHGGTITLASGAAGGARCEVRLKACEDV